MNHLPTGKSMYFVINSIASANRVDSGAPKDKPTIVSRLVNSEYWQRQCALFFPTEGNYTYASAKGATVDSVNKYTKGWDLENTTRLIWTNGYEFRPDLLVKLLTML